MARKMAAEIVKKRDHVNAPNVCQNLSICEFYKVISEWIRHHNATPDIIMKHIASTDPLSISLHVFIWTQTEGLLLLFPLYFWVKSATY